MLASCATSPSKPLPEWINGSSNGNSEVICSGENLDPEQAKIKAEDACLSSAMRSYGVSLESNRLTIDSLTGLDSSEVTRSRPLNENIKCKWTARHLEVLSSGAYRQWLKCEPELSNGSQTFSTQSEQIPSQSAWLSGIKMKTKIILNTIPVADSIVISNVDGVRSLQKCDGTSSVVDLKEGDTAIEIKKHGFSSKIIELESLKEQQQHFITVYLEKLI